MKTDKNCIQPTVSKELLEELLEVAFVLNSRFHSFWEENDHLANFISNAANISMWKY